MGTFAGILPEEPQNTYDDNEFSDPKKDHISEGIWTKLEPTSKHTLHKELLL